MKPSPQTPPTFGRSGFGKYGGILFSRIPANHSREFLTVSAVGFPGIRIEYPAILPGDWPIGAAVPDQLPEFETPRFPGNMFFYTPYIASSYQCLDKTSQIIRFYRSGRLDLRFGESPYHPHRLPGPLASVPSGLFGMIPFASGHSCYLLPCEGRERKKRRLFHFAQSTSIHLLVLANASIRDMPTTISLIEPLAS